jgi:hypothetical protein
MFNRCTAAALHWLLGLVVALVVVTPAAGAPPKCWPTATTTPAQMVFNVEVANSPPTAVAIGSVVYAASSIGLVYGWTCKAPDGQHYKHLYGGPWTAFAQDWLYLADKAVRGTDADREALFNQYATATEIDARLKPDADKVLAMLPNAPVAPTPGSLVVAPTTVCAAADKDGAGKCLRRPTYVWNGTTRATTAATEKADIGSACNPAVGALGFHGVLGRSDRVAPCVKN